MANDTTAFFGGGIPVVQFEKIGDSVTGEVQDKEISQQTDLKNNTLKYWPDGRPMMQVVVTLLVEPDDADDDGLRRLFVKGYMQPAIVDAVEKAGQRDLKIGNVLTVTFTREGEAQRGLNPPKYYEASIATA